MQQFLRTCIIATITFITDFTTVNRITSKRLGRLKMQTLKRKTRIRRDEARMLDESNRRLCGTLQRLVEEMP